MLAAVGKMGKRSVEETGESLMLEGQEGNIHTHPVIWESQSS